MQKPFENLVGVFSSLKNKNIRFNPRPWKTPDETVSSTNIEPLNDTFVDLHMEVAKKVDELIAEMEENKEDMMTENIKSTLKA